MDGGNLGSGSRWLHLVVDAKIDGVLRGFKYHAIRRFGGLV